MEELRKNSPSHVNNPGDSSFVQIHNILNERILIYTFLAVLFVGLAVKEWLQFLMATPPTPKFLTLVAVALVALAYYKYRKGRKLIERYMQGRNGEIYVGQMLEQLRTDGYEVFHDVPTDRGNIDHVVIGPGGVFVIETKTHSKPKDRRAEVEFDGENVTLAGFQPDRNPVAQVRAACGHVQALLERGLNTDKKLPIRPVLVYVNWYCKRVPRGSDLWLVNEKALMQWMRRNYKRVTPDEVRQAALCLETYVRSGK